MVRATPRRNSEPHIGHDGDVPVHDAGGGVLTVRFSEDAWATSPGLTRPRRTSLGASSMFMPVRFERQVAWLPARAPRDLRNSLVVRPSSQRSGFTRSLCCASRSVEGHAIMAQSGGIASSVAVLTLDSFPGPSAVFGVLHITGLLGWSVGPRAVGPW